MPFVSKIEARAYARATEVSDRVVASIMAVFPERVRPKVSVSTSRAEGQAGDIIEVISAALEGQEDCETVLNNILEQMGSGDRRGLARSLDVRLDDQCVFFLRIDKQAAFLGMMKLAEDPDVVSVRFHFRQYPRCRPEEVKLVIENQLRAAGGLS